MCISPNLLRDGTSVSCRKCWQCLEHRVDNWVGKCIAESKTSVGSSFITLTYGRDEDNNPSHARAHILTYSDVQKFFKQLRNRGFPCRYIAVGEYGSERGRAHWHIIAFWKKAKPERLQCFGQACWFRPKREEPIWIDIVPFKRMHVPCWPHGTSQWDPIRPGHEKGGIRYACKYINKDFGDDNWQGKFAMSKMPPLGSEHFEQRAQRFVDEGVSPQDPYYQFPDDARRKNGDIIRFKLSGRSLELFLDAFRQKWADQVGGHYPPSVLLDDYEDHLAREASGDYVYQDRRYIRMPSSDLVRPERRWAFNPPMGFADADIVWHCPDPFREGAPSIKLEDGSRIYYGPNKEGVKGWRNVLPEENVIRVLPRPSTTLLDLPQSPPPLAVEWLYGFKLQGRWSQAKVRLHAQKAAWLISLKR